MKTKKTKQKGCPHPPQRLYSWYARDDFAPGSRVERPGQILCIACCACGAILRGGC